MDNILPIIGVSSYGISLIEAHFTYLPIVSYDFTRHIGTNYGLATFILVISN